MYKYLDQKEKSLFVYENFFLNQMILPSGSANTLGSVLVQ